MCVFDVLVCVCGFPRLGAAGASHDNPRTPNVHISGSRRFKNTRNIQREDPQRERKRNEHWSGRGKKKSEIIGGPAEGVPGEGGLGRWGLLGSPGVSLPLTPFEPLFPPSPQGGCFKGGLNLTPFGFKWGSNQPSLVYKRVKPV